MWKDLFCLEVYRDQISELRKCFGVFGSESDYDLQTRHWTNTIWSTTRQPLRFSPQEVVGLVLGHSKHSWIHLVLKGNLCFYDWLRSGDIEPPICTSIYDGTGEPPSEVLIPILTNLPLLIVSRLTNLLILDRAWDAADCSGSACSFVEGMHSSSEPPPLDTLLRNGGRKPITIDEVPTVRHDLTTMCMDSMKWLHCLHYGTFRKWCRGSMWYVRWFDSSRSESHQ